MLGIRRDPSGFELDEQIRPTCKRACFSRFACHQGYGGFDRFWGFKSHFGSLLLAVALS
jgi:hypothetical protein